MHHATVVIPSVYHPQLDWFFRHNRPHLSGYQVIVVSSDRRTTPAYLAQQLPSAQLIALPRPLGFAKTVNLGFAPATTDWVATVNDDVQLCAGWLENMLDSALERTAGVNPVILSPDGSIESAGITLLAQGKAQPLQTCTTTTPYTTQALNAACVVYRARAWRAAGGFDERFGSYLEDLDLSLSLRRLGWELVVVPTVRVTHLKHQTTASLLGWKKSWYDARNWWLILLKHWRWSDWRQSGGAILWERARNLSGVVKALRTA